jgi:hypothetical protein
LLSK